MSYGRSGRTGSPVFHWSLEGKNDFSGLLANRRCDHKEQERQKLGVLSLRKEFRWTALEGTGT